MNAAKFEGFKFVHDSIVIHDDCVCFTMSNGHNEFDVELPTVTADYDVVINHTSDPQNDFETTTEGQEVAYITTEYSRIAVGKIIDFNENILAIENQPVLIDDQFVIEINNFLEEKAQEYFTEHVMSNLEHVLERIKNGYFDKSMPPEPTDVDVAIIDAIAEINDLKQQLAEVHASCESLLAYKDKIENPDYVLVPREPSKGMLDAVDWSYYPHEVYKAMISASQK